MGIATVHYLSMNVRDGQVVEPAPPVYEDATYTYTLTSLQADTDYIIDWGDTNTAPITTDADGAWEGTHVYVDPGDYTIIVTRVDTEQIVAEENITIAVD